MAVFTNETKNTSVFQNLIAHGKATILNDIKDLRFTDVLFEDGTLLKDVTFAQLVDQAWTLQTKNTSIFTNETKTDGFINIALVLIVALIASASTYFYVKSEENKLGVAVLQTQLSDTIGTFRTNVNTSLQSLADAISNSTSVDPGFKITSASVSGTISIAKGGTGTSTFNDGLVMASGTNNLDVIQTGANGQLLIASGTKWYANTLSAGSNISIANSAGTISISATAAASMAVLGSSTLTVANTTTTVTFTPKKYLMVYAYVSSTDVPAGTGFVFNGTRGGTAYSHGIGANGGAFSYTLRTSVLFTESSDSTSSTLVTANIANPLGQAKTITTHSTRGGLTTGELTFFDSSGLFATTTQISQIEFFVNNGALMSPGSSIIVYGSD